VFRVCDSYGAEKTSTSSSFVDTGVIDEASARFYSVLLSGMRTLRFCSNNGVNSASDSISIVWNKSWPCLT